MGKEALGPGRAIGQAEGPCWCFGGICGCGVLMKQVSECVHLFASEHQAGTAGK